MNTQRPTNKNRFSISSCVNEFTKMFLYVNGLVYLIIAVLVVIDGGNPDYLSKTSAVSLFAAAVIDELKRLGSRD